MNPLEQFHLELQEKYPNLDYEIDYFPKIPMEEIAVWSKHIFIVIEHVTGETKSLFIPSKAYGIAISTEANVLDKLFSYECDYEYDLFEEMREKIFALIEDDLA